MWRVNIWRVCTLNLGSLNSLVEPQENEEVDVKDDETKEHTVKNKRQTQAPEE